MPKTYKKKSNKTTTRKKRSSTSSIGLFEKQITVIFLEMLIMVKLFHWKTHSYAIHKATDDLYSSLNKILLSVCVEISFLLIYFI